MTKKRKIRRGDFVKYAGNEWIVKNKAHKKYELVRRQVMLGHTIWVPKKKLKLADQTWRSQLESGDPIRLFIGGVWTTASVYRREGNVLCIQPTFTHFTLRLQETSGKIAKCPSHNIPLWTEEQVTHVFHDENLRVERGEGLLFPWEYGKGIPVLGPQRKFLTKIKIPLYDTISYSLEMYKHLSTDEILWDVMSHPQYHPRLFKDIATQYCSERQPLYPILPQSSLEYYLDQALAHNDHRRVSELLSVGNKLGLFSTNEWAVQHHLSCPYIDVDISVSTHLEIDIFWSGVHMDRMTNTISTLLQMLSEPIGYSPKLIEVDHSPEMQYALSRMLGMESEPLQALHLRTVNNFYLTLHDGFCKPTFNKFGGVLNIYGMDYRSLITNLFMRHPLKTLVIVERDTIQMWSSFSIWYGSSRENGDIIVTTRNTFIRCWTAFSNIQRLVCFSLPSPNTVYEQTLRTFACKIRWAVCTEENEDRAWVLLQERPHPKARVRLTRHEMESFGVLFPIMSKQRVVCKCEHRSYRQIIMNTFMMSRSKRSSYVAKFLLHPELVPAHIRGEKLLSFEATLDKIADKIKLNKKVLEDRTKEKCSVCLETITCPTVTSCGHVFCEQCARELDTRNINCPMCRSSINGYIKVSDKNTPGKIQMYRGDSYRIPESETWGRKFYFLKRHPEATFITKYAAVKRKLRKHFPHTHIITEKALKNGMRVSTDKVIMIDAGINTRWLDYAWGRNFEIIEIIYKINI